MPRLGLLLINLGTPDDATVPAVRRYLAEFLSDPRVIDIPAVARWLLVHGIILRLRPRTSTAAYRKVWTAEGSPVLVHGRALERALADELGPDVAVRLGMRYQRPSIEAALDELLAAGVSRVLAFPMFPQYASAATGSAVEELYRVAGRRWNVPPITVVPPFYDDPGFIEAFAAVARPVLDEARPDRVLMSFHGLPERHILKSEIGSGHCLTDPRCCDRPVPASAYCYRAQCFATARGLAAALELPDDAYEVTFQSRLGRTPWIRPYTDVRLPELAREGVRHVAVLCPAFVADCLETLEEIAIRADEAFRAAGGTRVTLVPSLNASPAWVSAVARMTRVHLELAPL